MKCKITLTGRPSGAVKEVEGGIYEFLMKIDAAAPPMKGMKELGSSVYRVSVSKKAFDKIKDKIAPDTVLVMSGEQKASATKEAKQQPIKHYTLLENNRHFLQGMLLYIL